MKSWRIFCAGLISAFIGIGLARPAFAEKRVALVIGNSAYQNVGRLDNPTSDAKLMATTLSGLGFTLVGGGAQLNLDKAGFDSAVQSFGSAIVGADVGLFYYAGHGVQVRNSNYLVPVGANPTREADVFLQMVDIAVILSQMEGSGTKLNLVILDACRNNPFGGRGLRSTDSGLAQIRAPEGTLISYATQPGNVAKDGADGNSPFTKALAQTITRSGLDIFQAFNQVGLAVKRATGGEQQPWVSNSPIDGNFYFAGAPSAAPQPTPLPPPARTDPPPSVRVDPPKPTVSADVAVCRGPGSLWDFNGSTVMLKATPDSKDRKFYFCDPSGAARASGAQPGALVFVGQRAGSQYSGTAYAFASGCASVPYSVNGIVTNSDQEISMTGRSPVIDPSSCRVSSHRDQQFSLTYKQRVY